MPLTWFINDFPLTIYIETAEKKIYELFKDFASIFTSSPKDSKLNQSNSKIFELEKDYFVSADI